MAAVKEWQGIRYIMHLLIINLVACLAWLSGIAFAQLELGEAVTGSVSFPEGAIVCIGNLAVFFTSLLRGRLDLENGARDVLATNRGPKLKEMEMGSGLTTCGDRWNYKDAKVLMLSPNTSNSKSIRQFMKYVYHSHNVESILLKSLGLDPARKSKVVTALPCSCQAHDSLNHGCDCIVLWTEKEEIRALIARRMPGTLKPLSDSLCLLPCWRCLRNGCHGCNQGLLHVKQTEEDSRAESPQIHAEQSKSSRLQSAVVTAELCCDQFHECNCNVLWTDEEEIRMMVSRWMPGTLKPLSNSLCLLPSWDCLRRGCHGLLQTEEDSTAEAPEIHAEPEPERTLREKESNAESRGEIHVDVEETPRWRLTVEGSKAESPSAVCQMLDSLHWRDSVGDGRRCICIPLCEAGDDEWTKLMIRFLRCKDQVSREVRVMASEAMEKYIDRSGEVLQGVYQQYNSWSFILPRSIEVLVNIALTGWLKADGFSSALISRRVVRDYIVDGQGTGLSANAFLTSATIHCNESSVCQVLWLRGNIVGVRTLSYIVGSVNLICSIGWGVLTAFEGRYAKHSRPPSKPTLLIMLAFMAVPLLMDFLFFMHFVPAILYYGVIIVLFDPKIITYLGGMLLEIVYIVVGSVMVVKGMGIGRWVYAAFQALIWVKWVMGSYLLGDYHDRVDQASVVSGDNFFSFFNKEIMVYSCAFMLNAVLAGVTSKWEY